MKPDLASRATHDTIRLLVLGAIWGSSFLCIEIALRGFSPLSIAALRIALGAAALLLLAWLRGDRLPTERRTWWLLVCVGALNCALPFFLIGWAQRFIPSNLSAVLMATAPIVALVLAHFTTRDDRINRHKALGVALGFAGVLVLVGIDALAGMSSAVLGQSAIMLASVCYVSSAVLARRLRNMTPLMTSALVLGIASLYMVPLALWRQPPAAYPAAGAVWVAMLFLGLVPTALAYLLRYQLIRSAGVTFLSQVAYLIPMFAVLWGWLFLDEIPGARTWLALGLILVGVRVGRREVHRAA